MVGLGEGLGRQWLIRTEFHFGKMRKFPEGMVGHQRKGISCH